MFPHHLYQLWSQCGKKLNTNRFKKKNLCQLNRSIYTTNHFKFGLKCLRKVRWLGFQIESVVGSIPFHLKPKHQLNDLIDINQERNAIDKSFIWIPLTFNMIWISFHLSFYYEQMRKSIFQKQKKCVKQFRHIRQNILEI